jgi:hypothetical protein
MLYCCALLQGTHGNEEVNAQTSEKELHLAPFRSTQIPKIWQQFSETIKISV